MKSGTYVRNCRTRAGSGRILALPRQDTNASGRNASGEKDDDLHLNVDISSPAANDELPLADKPRIRSYHCDQIGTPRELTAESGEIVWQASYRAWGNTRQVEWVQGADAGQAFALEENAQKSQATKTARLKAQASALAQPLRFQGQYFDAETGLHYNRFRYYDPDCGRFLKHDPIGLNGNINTFAYAPNPIQWIDPLGLAVCKLSAADKKALGGPPKDMKNPHRYHIARESAPGNWSKFARGTIYHAQNILKKHDIDINKDLRNFTWAENGGGAHSKCAAAHVRDVLAKADKTGGKPEVEKALKRLTGEMRGGKFY